MERVDGESKRRRMKKGKGHKHQEEMGMGGTNGNMRDARGRQV